MDSASVPLDEPENTGKIVSLPPHSISIEKETENEETSEWAEWNVIDFLGMLHDEKKTKRKLTEKEMQSRIYGTFRFLMETITQVHQSNRLANKEQEWDNLSTNFMIIADIFCRIPNICSPKVDVAKKYQHEAGKKLSETETTSLMCMVVTDGWKTFSQQQGDSTVQPSFDAMLAALLALWNSSDCSQEATYRITGDPDFLETLKNIITAYLPMRIEGKEMVPLPSDRYNILTQKLKDTVAHYADVVTATEEEEKLVERSLSIIHNLSNVNENVPTLRDLHFVASLSPYLDSANISDRFKTLAALANMINENESEILQNRDDLFEISIKMLENALDDPTHCCTVHYGTFSAWECALIIHRLARNHRIKRLLVEMDCLPQLVKLAKIGTVEETREAVGAIWHLSFDKVNQKKILEDTELNIVDLLMGIIAKCEDHATKEAAYGTLRILGKDLQKNVELTNKCANIVTHI